MAERTAGPGGEVPLVTASRSMPPLTPGRIWYLLRTTCREGWSTPYWREVVRGRILRTPPVETPGSSACEIHVLTSHGDWLNLVWGLKSLFWYSGVEHALCIHEDGSLGEVELGHLGSHFPSARILPRHGADKEMESVLSNAPLCRGFRATNPLALKVFDFSHFLRAERMLLLDSDILFFGPVQTLAERIKDPGYRLNTLNRDWSFGYSVPPDVVSERCGYDLPPLINSGLGLLHAGSIDVRHCEELLGIPGVLGHPHRIEQTLIAACSARHGFEFLPREYDVALACSEPDHPCKHYTGPIRHLMYREGMRRLVRAGILEKGRA